MMITRNKENLIITIPLTQKEANCYQDDDKLSDVPNIIGVIEGEEYSFNQAIDMSYCGKSQQVGSPLVHFYGEKDEFVKLCGELDLDIEEYPVCAYCGEAIFGCFTIGDKGDMCMSCKDKV